MVDNLRFFAGAARCLEGKAAGEYTRGPHVDDPPRGGRGRGPDHALELPADDGDLEDRPGARRRLHDGAEARRDDADDDAQARRAGGRHPARRACSTSITGHGEPAGSSLVTHPDVDMVSLTGSPDTGKWIAKAASDTLKKVHLELGGKAPVVVFDDVELETALETIAGDRLLQRRPGLHRGDARARRQGRLRRLRLRASPSRPRARSWATRCPTTRRWGRSTPSASASASRGSSSAGPTTPRS